MKSKGTSPLPAADRGDPENLQKIINNVDDPTRVCQFSKKVDFLQLGRLCQISHPEGQSCFFWNKPEIFEKCPDRIAHFNWQKEQEDQTI